MPRISKIPMGKTYLPSYTIPELEETLRNFTEKKITQALLRSYIRKGKIKAERKDGHWRVSADEFVRITTHLLL